MLTTETRQEYSWFRRICMQFISDKDFEKLEKTSVMLNFKKGETILKQGGMPTHIVYLEKGIVKFNYESESGKNLILTIVSAPKILGGANLFYKDNNRFFFFKKCDWFAAIPSKSSIDWIGFVYNFFCNATCSHRGKSDSFTAI